MSQIDHDNLPTDSDVAVKLGFTEPILVDAPVAARLLSISVNTLRARTRDGTIPSKEVGDRVLYSPAALRKWAAEPSNIKPVEGPANGIDRN